MDPQLSSYNWFREIFANPHIHEIMWKIPDSLTLVPCRGAWCLIRRSYCRDSFPLGDFTHTVDKLSSISQQFTMHQVSVCCTSSQYEMWESERKTSFPTEHHTPKSRGLGCCWVLSVLEPGKCPRGSFLRPCPEDATAAPRRPVPAVPAVPAGASHLRVLHDLRADGEGVEPLLERCPQLSTRHAAVVASGSDRGRGSAWHLELDESAYRAASGSPAPAPSGGGRGLPEGGGAISVRPSLHVSESGPWMQPFNTCAEGR